MIITLTKEEINLADNVASARNSENRKAKRGDGKVLRDSQDIDSQGARAELAVAKVLNLKWDGAFLEDSAWQSWRTNGHDVSGLEVRSTRHRNGRLILHPSDKDDSVFVLVISADDPTFELFGWINGRNGKKEEWWHDVGYGRPCYFVPRVNLMPITNLEILKTK